MYMCDIFYFQVGEIDIYSGYTIGPKATKYIKQELRFMSLNPCPTFFISVPVVSLDL